MRSVSTSSKLLTQLCMIRCGLKMAERTRDQPGSDGVCWNNGTARAARQPNLFVTIASSRSQGSHLGSG